MSCPPPEPNTGLVRKGQPYLSGFLWWQINIQLNIASENWGFILIVLRYLEEAKGRIEAGSRKQKDLALEPGFLLLLHKMGLSLLLYWELLFLLSLYALYLWPFWEDSCSVQDSPCVRKELAWVTHPLLPKAYGQVQGHNKECGHHRSDH